MKHDSRKRSHDSKSYSRWDNKGNRYFPLLRENTRRSRRIRYANKVYSDKEIVIYVFINVQIKIQFESKKQVQENVSQKD